MIQCEYWWQCIFICWHSCLWWNDVRVYSDVGVEVGSVDAEGVRLEVV